MSCKDWEEEPWYQYTKEDILKDSGEVFTRLDSCKLRAPPDNIMEVSQIKEYLTHVADLQPILIIESSDIEVLLDMASVSEEAEYYIYPVDRVVDPIELMKKGFLPTSISTSTKWLSDYVNGVDVDVLSFYHPHSDVMTVVEHLNKESRWVYRSIDEWRRVALRDANSFALSLYAPDLLYFKSKRPINDMSMFRRPDSWKVSKKDTALGKIKAGAAWYLDGDKEVRTKETWNVIPVTRYTAGMRRGLFHGETPKEICGTFSPRSGAACCKPSTTNPSQQHTSRIRLAIEASTSILCLKSY